MQETRETSPFTLRRPTRAGQPLAKKLWRFEVGPTGDKVTAIEVPERKSVIYLRWREDGNWRRESLGESCRTQSGRLIQAVCDRAMVAARARLLQRTTAQPLPSTSTGTVTISDAINLAMDPTTGRWKAETPHGREVLRSLQIAVRIWGAAKTLDSLTRADWRTLWRTRLGEARAAGNDGYRVSELLVQRIETVTEWIVEEGYVLRVQRPERDWRVRLTEDYRAMAGEDPEPHRPRYTLEELRRLVAASREGDPRFALLMALGAELRPGQVSRARRRDLDLEAGTFTVRGRGKKRGTVVLLTPGQLEMVRWALAGYLRELEASMEDYPLFPAGQMPGGRLGDPVAHPMRHAEASVDRSWAIKQFRLTEQRAGIPHVLGRGLYGIRRAAVDAALELGISRHGLKMHGGWVDTQMPDRVYAAAENLKHAAEAARIRAQLRGEVAIPSEDDPAYTKRTQDENAA